MNNCISCKWWEEDNDMRPGWGSCNLTAAQDSIPEYKDSKAKAHDFEGYYAILKTRPDFGCVQWEAKDE